jgi:peroxiredoxin Q/BCP
MSKNTRKKSPKSDATREAAVGAKLAQGKPTGRSGSAGGLKGTVSNAKPAARKQRDSKAAPAKGDKPAGEKSKLAVGAKAPAFRLPRDDGQTVSLSDYSGRQLVLFFYPRANTPGCTKEAIGFTQLAKEFAKCGTVVLGVSADPLKAQQAFRDKHKLLIPLISDEKHSMLDAYGVWDKKSMYGKTFYGILRTTVLIGKDGRIAEVWRNVKVEGHAEAVLATVRTMSHGGPFSKN